MKLYRLGANQLRIHLSRKDLEAYETSLEELDYESARGRRVMGKIFDRAKEETGFDTAHERIYVQLYPISDGGCELFVTMLKEDRVEYDCFLFRSCDAFLEGARRATDAEFYRVKKTDTFYALIPHASVSPEILEFAEEVKAPSPLFLKRKCHRIHRKEDAS